jgi:hypothetical protein
MIALRHVVLVLLLSPVLFSCNKEDEKNSTKAVGRVVFQFEHYADGAPLILNEMAYKSAAGDSFEVQEIQYFLSDFTLHSASEQDFHIGEDDRKFAHYIDTNLPNTNTWQVDDSIPAGDYDALSFVFGIVGEKNTPYRYTDTPESNMLWPVNLGGDQGGYHYMKLNGFWVNDDGLREPFNFHLGVGQERDADNNITGFVQNWQRIELPAATFSINDGDAKEITIRMNVEEWWKNPNIYDHDVHGGRIMQNQEAMAMGAENAMSVFSVGSIATHTGNQ